MPYTVNRFQASVLDFGRFPVLLPDNTINKAVTPLKLIGKGVPDYGEHIAENFVWLLENFAGSSSPSNPLTGQLWYEVDERTTSRGTLRLWDGNLWRPLTTMGYGDTFHINPAPGDIFYRTDEKKLYYFNTTRWSLLGAPELTSEPPENAVPGEFWYDQSTAVLYIFHRSLDWQKVGPGARVNNEEPVAKGNGDLWFNPEDGNIRFYEESVNEWHILPRFDVVDFLPNSGREGDLIWQRRENVFYVRSQTAWNRIGPDIHIQENNFPPVNVTSNGYFWYNTVDNKIQYYAENQWRLPNSVYLTTPQNPLPSDLWWDTVEERLNIFDGTNWQNFAPIRFNDTAPTSGRNIGDFWWSDTDQGMYFFDGVDWQLFGEGSARGSSSNSTTINNGTVDIAVREVKVNGSVVGVWSDQNIPTPESPYDVMFPNGIIAGYNIPQGYKINDESISDFVNTQVSSALDNFTAFPLELLPYPEIKTPTKRFTLTPSAAVAGGQVTIAGNEEFTMGDGSSTTGTGSYHLYQSTNFVSSDLDTNSTYYLRVKIESGNPQFYTQQGTDTDNIPNSLKGTPNDVSGGGFDSTKVDMLIARVVTSAAGTVPVITNLLNANNMSAELYAEEIVSSGNTWNQASANLTINWARVPKRADTIFQGFVTTTNQFTETVDPNSGNIGGKVGARTLSTSRYLIQAELIFEDSQDSDGRIAFSLKADF